MFSIMSKTKFIFLYVIAMFVAINISSCSDDAIQEPEIPVAPTPERSALRFGMTDITSRSTSSDVNGDWYESKFSEGEKIGCVIYKYQNGSKYFAGLAEWHYNSSNRVLILDKIWINHEQIVKDYGTHHRKETFMGPLDPEDDKNTLVEWLDADKKNDGYIKLKQDGDFGFAFYHPFINAREIIDAFLNLDNETSLQEVSQPYSRYFLPKGTMWDGWHVAQNFSKVMMTGLPKGDPYNGASLQEKDYYNFDNNTAFEGPKTIDIDGTNLTVSCTQYDWQVFPIFVNYNQGNEMKQDKSNFMFVDCHTETSSGKPINKDIPESQRTIELSFVRQMAAIDLVVEDMAISNENIYFVSPHQAETLQELDKGIVQGVTINMANGTVSQIPHKLLGQYENPQTLNMQKYQAIQYTSLTQDKFYPNNVQNDKDIRRWRLLLPPQTGFECELHFDVTVNGKTEHKNIRIDEAIKELKGNHLYTIYLKKDNWKIEIRDWAKGDNMLIEESTNEM